MIETLRIEGMAIVERAELEFAAGLFSRVAIFMVRDDEAIGMAQSGLTSAGGPDDSEFRQVSISTNEPARFRSVLQSGEGEQAPPRDDGDRRLAALLGSSDSVAVSMADHVAFGVTLGLLYGAGSARRGSRAAE